MENNLPTKDEVQQIDSNELLLRFIMKCSNSENDDFSATKSSSANLVSAVYYFRKYPDINDFLSKHLKDNKDYFLIQWTRTTWAKLSSMTEEEISDLVINQICLVDNSEEAE